MALATAKITDLIDKVISALNDAEIDGIVGVYFGDQEGFSAYPVICVGSPPLLNENFPVIAGGTIRDETYNIPVILYVEYEDTLANKKLFYNLTGAIREALRVNYFDSFVYDVKIQQTVYAFGQKGNTTLRISETTVQYMKRITNS